MSDITLVCFDMAGTTVRDDGAVDAAFSAALDAVGVTHGDARRPTMLDYVHVTMGSSKIRVFEALFPDDPDTPPRANAAFEAAYDDIVEKGEVSPMPGAEELMASLRDRGVKVALLTGFSASTRDKLVAALGWSDIADLLVCPEEAGRGRPYPDMVLHAIVSLAIDDVAQVCVVGDTAADIQTGLRAGASIVAGVLSGADGKDRLSAAGATHVLTSVVDLPPVLFGAHG